MSFTIRRSTLFVILVALLAHPSDGSAASRPNVLLIAVDDLRPELGCYGHSNVKSQNIDRFAASGRLFQRAYCQQAVCNPSRTSMMTGLRPDSIGVTGNHVHFRSNRPNVVTLSQLFMQHGYHAQSIGKIYHGVFPDGASKTTWDTMGDPASWSVPTTRFGPRYYYTESGIDQAKRSFIAMYRPSNPGPDDWTHRLVFGPMTEAPVVDDQVLYDGQVATTAIDTLRKLKATGKPFFLAVGFIKPHSPFVAAKKYWDLYDPAEIRLADRTTLPVHAPAMAGHGSGEIRRYTDQPKSGDIPAVNQRRMKHGYYACISYVDAQIGRVLESLEEEGLDDNTIVVLFGDHGYHLGEHGLWGKTTNFELDTRVPLIIRVPRMNQPGRPTRSLAELVDLYPTLAELAELPVSGHLEGTSLAQIVASPAAAGPDDIAISQYPRGKAMGYSLRTDRWRYTEWIEQSTGHAVARELYDHADDDPVETVNVADEDRYAVIAVDLSKRLRNEIGVDLEADRSTSGTGFEEFQAGGFTKIANALGQWTAQEGHVEIDSAHRRSGRQCLHLYGGENRSVVLKLNTSKPDSSLVFHAERWTRRSPFRFRVEQASDGDQWQEIYRGDDVIRIGGFLTKVTVPLKGSPSSLRFSCSSPPGSGILIDDLSVVPPTRQKVVRVAVENVVVPVLVGADLSPLLHIRVDVEGILNPISLSSTKTRLAGTVAADDVTSVQMFASGGAAQFGVAAKLFGKPKAGLGEHSFVGNHLLQHGANHFWLSCSLDKDANIDGTIQAVCESVGFSDGTSRQPVVRSVVHQLGVAVRQGGDDDVHTYRIPGLATTDKGTLIGVYDVRHRGSGDLPGDIDVGMSRSTDGGRTWEPMRVIMDMGDDPQWRHDGIGDPAVLVDRNSGTIWVAATWSHGNRSWFGSGPGLKPEETGQLMLTRSDDDGVTWCRPFNITEQVKRPEWCFLLQGPGKGITMRDGTLVFAAQYQDPIEQKRLPHSTIIYSQDHGKTWQVGTGAFDDTTESQVVEVEPGVLMLNCRYNRSPVRVVMTTRDMGQTWQKHFTSERSLIEPGACMASLIDIDQEVGGDVGGWLLFSNPDSVRGRHHITMKASPDRGMTWPKENRLLLDEGSGRGYSCLSMIDRHTVGILYEGSQAQLTFQRIPLRNLVHGGASEQARPSPRAMHLALPRVFGDHMVLQADAEIPIWGQAKTQAKVTIQLGGEKHEVKADRSGQWQVRLRARPASATQTELRVESAGEQVCFTNVVIGEVWICAGQSNMAWPLNLSANGTAELSAADHPNLRLLHLAGRVDGSSGVYTPQHLASLTPDKFCVGEWKVASTESAVEFSAVAWYFGRHLQHELRVPVGLICPAVGGTPTEAWIPREALERDPQLKALVAGNWLDNPRLSEFCRTRGQQNLLPAIQAGESLPGDDLGPNHSFKPGFMWSAGIQPLLPYAIRGVVWYQGESNAENPSRVLEHGQLFPLLVGEWRKRWGQGDFPVLFVQLPGVDRPDWPLFREGQRRMLDQLNNVGMAISIDTGHPTNVHPVAKKPVGERLAKWALGTTYRSNSHTCYSGPLLDVVEREGDSIVAYFKQVGVGLKSTDESLLRHFEICGGDGVFHPATAKIIGKNSVSVSSPHVAEPQHVRYVWQPFPDPPVNLINSEGLPASPFSTRDECEWRASRSAK